MISKHWIFGTGESDDWSIQANMTAADIQTFENEFLNGINGCRLM
jgi:hypothetical protein